MINKAEIDAKSQELGVHTSHVQRDYVFGWLLSGIYHNGNALKDLLVLKGGNAFRKAYFEHARYSNDLDFSAKSEINPEQLKEELNKACRYAADLTNINFTLEQNRVFLKSSADKDDKTYEARVYFKGFYGEESYNIKVKLDVKEYDKIFLPPQRRNIIHSYSDAADCKGEIVCHKLEELLASKLKALLQRQYSPDLYDFIFTVFFQKIIDVDRLEIIKTFLKKTIYEPNPMVAKNLLLEVPFQTLKAFWNQYLACPRQSLINFDEAENQYKLVIPQMFGLLQPSYATVGGGGFTGGYGGGFGDGYSLNYFSSNYRNIIMEAGRRRKVLRMTYDGLIRMVEPYSLAYKVRKDGVGREYFYGWDRTGGRSGQMTIKSYTQDKIQSLELTDETFEPRFPIELSKAGEYIRQRYFSRPLRTRISTIGGPRVRTSALRRRTASSYGFSITVECPICNKRFKRASYNTKLNKHKDKYGNQCYGTIGYVI